MSFTITKEETYNLIKLENDAFASPDKLLAECEAIAEEAPFFVLNCSAVEELETHGEGAIFSLYKMAKSNKGSLIIAELAENLKAKFEKEGIQCLPTEDEAVDYIFMEQLERQIGGDEDWD